MKRVFFIIIITVFVLSTAIGYMSHLYLSGINPIESLESYFKSNSIKDDKTEELDNTEQDNGKSSVMISFAGDVLLDRGVASLIDKKGADYILSEVKNVFAQSDITMVNLECPVSDRGIPAKDKQYTFRAKPQSLEVLTLSGIDIVTLANNHILDYGREALTDTFKNLRDRNILYAGAGNNIDEASRPVYIERNGLKVAFIASSRVIPYTDWSAGENTSGVATTYSPERLLKEIENAKKQSDIVVVYVHWGEELKEQPQKYQISLARGYIDKGADIVIGTHPHVLQGIEFYKGKVISYSMGNFVFTNSKKDTMILEIEANKKGVKKVRVIPCRIENLRTVILKDKSQASQVIEKVRSLSFGVKVDPDGNVKPE